LESRNPNVLSVWSVTKKLSPRPDTRFIAFDELFVGNHAAHKALKAHDCLSAVAAAGVGLNEALSVFDKAGVKVETRDRQIAYAK